MNRPGGKRPQRKRIFIGCEGASEMGYAGWLRNLVRPQKRVHLEISNLGEGAGDPLARVDLALQRLRILTRDKEPFVGQFLFLDTDQLAADPVRADMARRRANDHGITIIWQEPTYEAFLLRHLPGEETRRPPDKVAALLALRKAWGDDYRKGLSAEQIEQRLTRESALSIAKQSPALASLLALLELDDSRDA